MKTLLCCLYGSALFALPLLSCHAQEVEQPYVLVPLNKAAKEVPLFFSATAKVEAHLSLEEVTTVQQIALTIHQGKPGVLSLGLSGAGEVVSVVGEGLRDWSVRIAADGARFLDLRPLEIEGAGPLAQLEVTLGSRHRGWAGVADVLLAAPGSATGFSLDLAVSSADGVELGLAVANGLVPVEESAGRKFVGRGAAALAYRPVASGSGARGIELRDAAVTGRLMDDGESLVFRLTASARSAGAGSLVELFGGNAALSDGLEGDGWHVALRRHADRTAYELSADREGDLKVDVGFVVPVTRDGDWRVIDFRLPAGVAVPLRLEGLPGKAVFDRARSVVPQPEGAAWLGYLPVDGAARLAWRAADDVGEGSLFFSGSETIEVRVGSGLLRQSSRMDLRVLQGKLEKLVFRMEGAGEVVSVGGEGVIGWSIREGEGDEGRLLDVSLSRPVEEAAVLIIGTQLALTAMPVKVEPLRFSPVGALRHSGWLRVANDGAVRVGLEAGEGLVQMPPAQFPGDGEQAFAQVFAYRFPSEQRSYVISADQIAPETSVNEVTVYELAETDRHMTSDIELDIREAPLTELLVDFPADHAVALVSGAAVADYAVSSEVSEAGLKRLRVLFRSPVIGRQLVRLRLEKNEPAAAGVWTLVPLVFPEARTSRGYVGAVVAAGYRLTASTIDGLAEAPVSFFPKQSGGLQQAFRIRDGSWSATLQVESLARSVQADVFHLHSLKAGAAYGSVLINYFVTGAPATEWRVQVPEEFGNLEVSGEGVGRDWRREEGILTVPLSRTVLGAGTLLLTFEQTMGARGGLLSPGSVKVLDVAGERGYVQVVSPSLVNSKVTGSSGPLLSLDPSELPVEFRLLSNAPTLELWQYTSPAYEIAMQVEWFGLGETVGQVVEFMSLGSRLSRDGQWVTDARLFVKSLQSQPLRLTLPAGSALWEARVNGETVNARTDAAETLIPILDADPNVATEVTLRYGGSSPSATRASLAAPAMACPVVLGEWTVSGDSGRELVHRNGTANLISQSLPDSAAVWLKAHSQWVVLLLGLALVAMALGHRSGVDVRGISALVLGSAVIAGALALAVLAVAEAKAGGPLAYSAPALSQGDVLSIDVGNLPGWRARTGWPVWLGLATGFSLLVAGLWAKDRAALYRAGGISLIAAGLIMVRGGAAVFLLLMTVLMAFWLLPRVLALFAALRKSRAVPPVATAVAGLMLLMALCAGRIEGAVTGSPAESMIHQWDIRDGRLYGSVEVVVRAEAGERFLLLVPPAVLGKFTGFGLRVDKGVHEGADAYFLVAEEPGRLSGRAEFEMPLANPEAGWQVPAGPAALRRITATLDQPGWVFASPAAAQVVELPGENGSSVASLLLAPADSVEISARPRQRDAGKEVSVFYAEVSNLYLPSSGVVTGRHQVMLRPAQGRVHDVRIQVPTGLVVGDVLGEAIGQWRFDPESGELRLTMKVAQESVFGFVVETQQSIGRLPANVILAPLRVSGAAGEVGALAVVTSEDAQLSGAEGDGLSKASVEESWKAMFPESSQVVVQQAFHYGSADATLRVRVEEVEPELRADFSQLVSIGDDRLVVAVDLTVDIKRAGVFNVGIEIPAGLEIETVTGESMAHWGESEVDGKRVLTLHLTGKLQGGHLFSLTLAGQPPGAMESWTVPRLSLLGASRESGRLVIAPGRGLQVRASGRANVSQATPQSLSGDIAGAAARPGALAFRLLNAQWDLKLAIERLDPWVTARVFHDATLREGQLLEKIALDYRIENAALKSLRIRIPDLDAEAAGTVRGTGTGVAELVPVADSDGLWEIRFERAIAGNVQVRIEYQRRRTDDAAATLAPVEPQELRQVSYLVAVRAGDRLDIRPGELPRGWERTDWAVAQASHGAVASGGRPRLVFRVADAEGPLPLLLERHELAGSRRVRVAEAELTSLLSPGGRTLTAVALRLDIVDKETLRMDLPADAELYHVFVNDEGAVLVREDNRWLFHVAPSPDPARPATLRFVFSSPTGKNPRLEGPVLDVPMENLSWRVLVPEGWALTSHRGDFELKQRRESTWFGLQEYQQLAEEKRDSDSKGAAALLDQAGAWMRSGDQERAGLAFSNAMRTNQLDEASNEDARVQLRQLKTQQAVLGINTRRQRMTLDNRQVEEPAHPSGQNRAQENPVLQGEANYDPREFDRLLADNSAEENAALRDIAARIVSQQLAAEPAPAALDLTLPERGTLIDFARSVQIDGTRPVTIDLQLRRERSGGFWLGLLGCATLAGLAAGRQRRADV